MNKEYIEVGAKMLDNSVSEGISNIKDKDVRNAMNEFWSGKISWEEQINMICKSFDERIMKEFKNTNFK